MIRIVTFTVCLVLSGCATPHPRVGEDAARAVAVSYARSPESKVLGPISKNEVKDLNLADTKAAFELLDQGAFGFAVYVPDYSQFIHTDKGLVEGMIKLERFLFVKDGRVLGDFKAK